MKIEAPHSWQFANWGELWEYRELLFFLVWRDIKVRYKQTVLGALWAILQPVMTTIVFTIFFGKLGGLSQRISGAYPVFVYASTSSRSTRRRSSRFVPPARPSCGFPPPIPIDPLTITI